MKMLHEKKKKEFLKIENSQCSHLGCFSGCEGRIWKGKLFDSEAVFTLDYANFVKHTFKKEFLKLCRNELNMFHSVPAGNSRLVKDEPYVKRALGEIFLAFHVMDARLFYINKNLQTIVYFVDLLVHWNFLELTKQQCSSTINVLYNAMKIKLVGNLHMM